MTVPAAAVGKLTEDRHDRYPRLTSIQALRGAAALAVVAYHAGHRSGLPVPGAFGVDVFFVISGFIMMYVTNDASKPLPFLRDRLLRIAPTYWAATIVALAVHAYWTGGGHPPLKLVAGSFAFFPVDEPDAPGRFFPVHDVGWTLNYEMFFYAIFALTLLLPSRWRLPVLTAIFLVFVTVGMALQPRTAPLGFWTKRIILEFLAGALLAYAWRRWGLPKWAALPLILSGSAVLLLAGRPAILGATLVVAGVLALPPREAPWKLPQLLGDASYSIYLWHIFAVQLVPWKGPAGFVLSMAAGVTVGLCAYYAIERPIRRRLSRLVEARRGRHSPSRQSHPN
jgi:exopolysaccharide production protein ExoZ